MAKRRTKADKMIARLRRETVEGQNEKKVEYKPVIKESARVSGNFYQPEIELPIAELKIDLTKSLVITILAVTLQMGLYYYMNYQGGWKTVLDATGLKIERR